MKKFGIFLFALALLFVTGSAHAVVPPSVQVGVVQGLITGPDSNPLVGADVDVVCHGVTKSAVSDGSGFYTVQYVNEGCTVGETADVTATKNGQTGMATGTMQNAGGTDFVTLDIAVVHVPVVPEFGLITGAIALVSSAASYIFAKRQAA